MDVKELNDKLIELESFMLKKKIISKKTKDANDLYQEKQMEVKRYNKQLFKEQEDVKELETFTFKNIFTTLLGTKSEKLSKEQKELMDFAIKKDALLEELETIKEDYFAKKKQLDSLPDYHSAKEEIMKKKEELLVKTSPKFKDEYDSITSRIHVAKEELIKVNDALRIGKHIVELLRSAKASLKESERLHKWDTMTKDTGLINHIRKHNSLDSANASISRSRQKIKIFNNDLRDIKSVESVRISGNVSIDRNKDFFFDNIFTNLNIRHQIGSGITGVERSISNTQKALSALDKLKYKYSEVIESQSLLLTELIREY